MVIHMAGLSLRVDKSIAFQLECRLVIELKLPEDHAVTMLVSSLVLQLALALSIALATVLLFVS